MKDSSSDPRVLDVAAASELIDAQFPDFAPLRVVPLGEGCDSVAFEVNDAWVFRFPKDDDVARQLELESRLLPVLAGHLPFPIPAFRHHGRASKRFPRAFVGYPKLPGVPAIGLQPDRLEGLAVPLGSFLSALHSFPVADAIRSGVPHQRLADTIGEAHDDALENLPRIREVAPDAPLEQWRRFLAAGVDVPATSPDVLLHNDLAAEHVLVDPSSGTITGVIDWSDVAIGHPAVDFAGLFHWGGKRLARGVLEEYEGSLDEPAVRVARYLAACRGAMDVAFGLDRGRPEYVRAGVRALQLCTGVRS